MTTIAIVYHSGYGHTAVVAEAVSEVVTRAGATPKLLKIENAAQDFAAFLEEVSQADAVIFGAPTYMGDISAPLKAFFEASAGIWMKQGWKDKIAAGFTNGLTFAGDKGHSLTSMVVLAMQHGMIWVGSAQPLGNVNGNTTSAPEAVNRLGYSMGVVTQSDNASPDVTPPPGDRESARLLGERVAKITAKFSA
ncbi:flavodoxin family protein [Rhabdaerophilum sp.]|uniref:flavodoxin family protein n=1 Tax=Rhabdaerophilum sp. TaxID=2717341 RepID=UPI0038D4546A